jgi:hypothetical protein
LVNLPPLRSEEGEPIVLGVGEWDDGEAELAEEDGVLEDGGVAHLGEGAGVFEKLARFDPGFMLRRLRRAWGLEMPSQMVSPSRTRSSKE